LTSRSQPDFPALDPATYLDLAKELASRSEAASKRTAGDRAYYAAFLFSRDQLASKNYITPYYNEQDHQYVPETLKKQGVLGSLGNDEQRLRRARNRLTYDTRSLSGQAPPLPSLEWMLNTAQEIIDRVRALPRRN